MAGKVIIALLLLACPALALDYIVTWDSRYQTEPQYTRSGLIVVDMGTRGWRNPDFDERLQGATPPALFDAQTYVGVTITETLQQARSDLASAISNACPAQVARKNREARDGKKLKDAQRTNSANVGKSASWNQAQPQITNSIELLQLQLDELMERVNRAGIR